MAQYLPYILGAFLVSALCGFIMMPLILRFCKMKGLYDLPNKRKIHKNAVPRLGGISFLPSMLLASMIVIFTGDYYLHTQQVSFSLWTLCFFCSLIIIYCTGIVDDLVGLGATTKFSAQILASILLPFSGLWINNLYGFLGIHAIPFWFGAPFTVFVIIFACNAINLIDGIDGLSASLSLFALTGFLYCFLREGMHLYCILIAGLMGVLIPFLYYNIWGDINKNQKIFMGDSGSLTLGYILGFLFVKFTMDNPNVAPFRLDSMMLAYSLLVVPVYDVVRVSLLRLIHGDNIFQADKNHIHHKLIRAGLNQHQALLSILVLAVLFCILNILLWPLCNFSFIVVIDIVVWLLFHIFLNKAILRNGNNPYQANLDKDRHD